MRTTLHLASPALGWLAALAWGVLAQVAAAQQAPSEQQLVAEAAYHLQTNLAWPVDERLASAASMDELLRQADPEHGAYYTQEERAAMRQQPDSGTNAFGLLFHRRNGRTMVLPLAQGPAAKAGLLPGDELERLDGQDPGNLSVMRLLQLLAVRDRPPARVTVRRAGAVVTVVVQADPTFARPRPRLRAWPADDILLLRPPLFTEGALQASADALGAELRRRDVRGVVLDLRSHTGGLLHSAVGHAALFLPAGALVAITSGRIGVGGLAGRTPFLATPEHFAFGQGNPLKGLPAQAATVPVAVLVDAATGGGAELVAAALQAHRRGPVVGQRSVGHASLQTATMLGNGGAVVYTTAIWRPASGVVIDGVGVQPDHPTTPGQPDADVAAAVALLRQLPPRPGQD